MAGRAVLQFLGATETRASTAMTPVSSAQTGLRSISRIRKVGHQLRQSDQEKLDGALVGGGHVAIGLENARYPRLRDQALGQRKVQRRQGHGLVADDFDRGAALAENDNGSE
jgi:hypothetical protein